MTESSPIDLRTRICTEARKWIGTPWVHQHYHKAIGCDCIGLLRGVALALGIADARDQVIPRQFLGYGRAAEPQKMLAALSLYMKPIALPPATTDEVMGLAKPGDALWMKWDHEQPRHVGILMPDNHVIHAYSAANGVVEHILDAKWRRRVVGAFAFPGAE